MITEEEEEEDARRLRYHMRTYDEDGQFGGQRALGELDGEEAAVEDVRDVVADERLELLPRAQHVLQPHVEHLPAGRHLSHNFNPRVAVARL
jgi:hypothetical protein